MNAGKLGLLSVGLIFSLAACDLLPGGGPTISSFTATPSTIMSGDSSTLTWSVDSPTSISISGGVGDVTNDASATVTPSMTTEYTLTATSATGTSTRKTTVTVSGGSDSGGGGGTGSGDPASAPEGDFGVSTSTSGTFYNDTGDQGPITGDDDTRVISVAAGSTFYAQVDYTDPDGIASINIILQNGSPDGLRGPLSSTPRGGFTVGEPTGCDLSSSPTEVTCVYPITVEAGTVDISELDGAGSEFAYVFRANVYDSLSNSVLGSERGYVNVN